MVLTGIALRPLAQAGEQQKPAIRRVPARCGPLRNQVLSCPKFGFTYTVPFGWVDRTSDFQDEGTAAPTGRPANSETLLAAFERPPGAPGEAVNSAVVIVSESLANYPALKRAADYFGPLGELAEGRGLSMVNQPRSIAVAGKQLIRGDFSRSSGNDAMWQSSLVTIEKGRILSFTFVATSLDETDELIERLRFSPARRAK